jgi:hypothetical protein
MAAEAMDKGFLTVLKGYPIFSILDDEQLREVAETAKVSNFGRDQMVVKQGEVSETFLVILKGLVELRFDGRPIARLGPGQFFGETALVSDSLRSATAVAIRRTSCLVLSGSELRSYPAIVVKLLEETTRRNRAIAMQAELPASSTKPPVLLIDADIGFKFEKTRVLFDSLVRFFTEDYMVRRLFLDQAGWRTVGELSAATKIPHATLYGAHGNYGAPLNELISRGLIETRIFSGQRGRGGEVLRARIAYDKEPVKRYVDGVVMKRKSDLKR